MAKQKWVVKIRLTETEGQNTNEPWYTERDIVRLIQTRMNQLNMPQDLTLVHIKAIADSWRYF